MPDMPSDVRDRLPAAAPPTRAPARGPRLATLVVGLGVALLTAGCGHGLRPPVQPWQREHLAKRAMRFDADPLETRFRQHWFGAREGSDLGYGQPGGGCGCN
jgi:hypothetical protein